jgi:DNA-binding response OmpR family regulator
MKKKILIIDDDEEMCEELVDILEDEGFSVKVVFNGIAGKNNLDKEDFDILLLDIKIPGLSGIEILKDLKQKGKKIETIVLTGRPINEVITKYGNKLDKEEELLKYEKAVINKPFKVEYLLRIINE